MRTKCKLCKTQFDDQTHRDCGGDCLTCMAAAGDLTAIGALLKIRAAPESEYPDTATLRVLFPDCWRQPDKDYAVSDAEQRFDEVRSSLAKFFGGWS